MSESPCIADIIVGSALNTSRLKHVRPAAIPDDFRKLIDRAITHAGIKGASIYEVRGFWQGDSEPSAAIRLIGTDEAKNFVSCRTIRAKALSIGRHLQRDLEQQAVLVLFRPAAGKPELHTILPRARRAAKAG